MNKMTDRAADLGVMAGDWSPTIHRTVEEELRRSGYMALRHVACIARGDLVYLQGRLPSYFLKQVAQELAARVEGVRRVINRIDVRRPARAGTEERD